MSAIEQLVAVPVLEFVVEVEPAREMVRVRPVGELDLITGPELRDHVAELLAVGFEHVVIDLRGLSFMDATGVSLLLSLAAQARRERWRLSLIRGDRQVQRIFALTDTLRQLPFRPLDRA
jgi:anti-sigma B factor antagonist